MELSAEGLARGREIAKIAAIVRDPIADLPSAVAAVLDDELRSLTTRTLIWANEHDVRPVSARRHPGVLAVVSSVYALFCAPPSPSSESIDWSARFIMLFLCIDDADDEDVALVVSNDASSIGPLSSGFDAWRESFEGMRTSAPVLREHFDRSFLAYLDARKTESELSSRTLSLDEHWRIRRATIFMEPYIDQWMISTGIDPLTFDESAHSEARKLCIDIVLVANDLGSVGRDGTEGDSPTDLNLVHAYRRENGWSAIEAIEGLVALHDDLASRFEEALALTALGPSSAVAYGQLLRGLVVGNLRALRTLVFRYPDVGPILDRMASRYPEVVDSPMSVD